RPRTAGPRRRLGGPRAAAARGSSTRSCRASETGRSPSAPPARTRELPRPPRGAGRLEFSLREGERSHEGPARGRLRADEEASDRPVAEGVAQADRAEGRREGGARDAPLLDFSGLRFLRLLEERAGVERSVREPEPDEPAVHPPVG